ncbi:MAG: DNA repair protein RecN [Lachnospiraceae bacterium]|nr:DNA repair protein RecN [Lachnospiraceae bacterium]
MLLNLHIKNIALIDDLDIGFEDGLNILTGETGAGKSIIIGSLGICLGEKFNKDLLRNQDEDGLVELIFTIENEEIEKKLAVFDVVPDEDNQILISRRVNKSGRTVNRINDVSVTTSKIRETAELLIDLHAQHEQQTLLKKNRHLEILDKFGKEKINARKQKVSEAYKNYCELKEKLDSMNISVEERLKKKDFLTYRINEIESASLKKGEDEELERLYKKAVNSKDILGAADEIYKITGYDNQRSAANEISHALITMKKLSELDGELSDSYNILQDIDGLLNDFNRDFSDYMKSMEFDEAEFLRIEERLNLINSLKAKYGSDIKDILSSLDELKKEMEELNQYDQRLEEVKNNLDKAKEELESESNVLSEIRKEYAKKLCELIEEALKELNFMTVSFDMEFKKLDSYSENGNDDAYFMLSTNVGEPMRPLYEIASGGELSRVMLAVKACLANEDDTPTLVFDEIDVGISGATAQKVAEKMSVISRNHQVICITHLPQIAAMADYHYVINKEVENNKTVTKIRKLNKSEEIDELARIIGGFDITDAILTSAKQMKGLADRTKLY